MEQNGNVHDGATQALACVRSRVIQLRAMNLGGQGLSTVAVANVSLRASSRKEATVAIKARLVY